MEDFRVAMARFPSAVTIVTACTRGGERRGITATAVCSVTADPPSVLVCLNSATGTCAAVEETGRFAVNLLSDSQDELAMRFAGRGGVSGGAKFEAGEWQLSEGLPVLGGAPVTLVCEVGQSVLVGTHRVFVGEIIGIDSEEGAALLYEKRRFCRVASSG